MENSKVLLKKQQIFCIPPLSSSECKKKAVLLHVFVPFFVLQLYSIIILVYN